MVDLGVYNFVKKALAAGKSKQDIIADLSRGAALSEDEIERVFAAVAARRAPMPGGPRDTLGIDTNAGTVLVKRPARGYLFLLGLALCFALIGGIAFLLEPQILNVQGLLHGANQVYQNSIQGIGTH